MSFKIFEGNETSASLKSSPEYPQRSFYLFITPRNSKIKQLNMICKLLDLKIVLHFRIFESIF